MSETLLKPLAQVVPSPSPWTCNDEATIHDAAGHCVCVLGDPFSGVTEQDVANGAAIVVLPELLAASEALLEVRPRNWDEGEDPQRQRAWLALERALRRARGQD